MKRLNLLRLHKLLAIMALLILTVSSGLVAGVEAETGIRGQLVDKMSGDPVAGAWVAIIENNHGANTDSLGWFEIKGIPAGNYNLIITHPIIGTISGQTNLAVKVTDRVIIEVKIKIDWNQLKEEEIERSSGSLTKGSQAVVGLDHIKSKGRRDKKVKQQNFGKGYKQSDVTPIVSSETEKILKNHRKPRITPIPQVQKSRRYFPHPIEIPDDMFFKDYGKNSDILTSHDQFSTFALDVDDASYIITRRYLQMNQLSPLNAIRIEEFINHFTYEYNPPVKKRFRVFSETCLSPFNPRKSLLKIAIKGREIVKKNRKPINVTFVIDVSGSMGRGNRFQLVRDAVKLVTSQLNRNDRVAIIAYGSQAFKVLEPVTGNRQDEIERAMRRLSPGGSTYAEAGLKLGFSVANKQFVQGHNNIVMLLSDGVANVGRTSPDEIMLQIEQFANKGITLSTYGFGMGNYNDHLMEQLAQKGNGRYSYVNNANENKRVFVDQFVSNVELLARDVKIQVEFNPQIVKSYRLMGYENRDVADHRFRDDQQDGGEIGAGHEVTAIYEITLASRCKVGKMATVYLRWKEIDGTEVTEVKHDISSRKTGQSLDAARPELRLAIVAGQFAELLKGGSRNGGSDYNRLAEIARPLHNQLPGQQTDELISLIETAERLNGEYYIWDKDIDEHADYRVR